MAPWHNFFLAASVMATVMELLDRTSTAAARQYYTFYLSPSQLTWLGGDQERVHATKTGAYVPRNILFTKIQMFGSKAFLLSPRYRSGVPFTLSYFDVADPAQPLEPAVMPFPSAELHDCDGRECLANAVDFALDDQGVLWVLDVGTVNTHSTDPLTVGPPKVWGLDGSTGEVVLTVDLSHHTTNRTVLQFVAADYTAAGHVMLYVSDSGAGCLLVYNGRYKTVHRLSFPALAKGSGGRDDNDDNDILYMEYVKRGPLVHDGRILILTYFAGRQVYNLDVSSVTEPDNGGSMHMSPVAKYVGEKPIKMVVIGSDAAGHLYFRNAEQDADEVYSWHVDKPLAEQSFSLRRRTPDCRKPTHAAPGGAGLMWLLETDVKDFVNRRVGCMGSSSRLQAIAIT